MSGREGSLEAEANMAKARAARRELYPRRYPEEETYYIRLHLPMPPVPSRHDREALLRRLQKERA